MHTALRGSIAGIALRNKGTTVLVLPGDSKRGGSDFDILYSRPVHQPGGTGDAPLTDPFAGGVFIPERPHRRWDTWSWTDGCCVPNNDSEACAHKYHS